MLILSKLFLFIVIASILKADTADVKRNASSDEDVQYSATKTYEITSIDTNEGTDSTQLSNQTGDNEWQTDNDTVTDESYVNYSGTEVFDLYSTTVVSSTEKQKDVIDYAWRIDYICKEGRALSERVVCSSRNDNDREFPDENCLNLPQPNISESLCSQESENFSSYVFTTISSTESEEFSEASDYTNNFQTTSSAKSEFLTTDNTDIETNDDPFSPPTSTMEEEALSMVTTDVPTSPFYSSESPESDDVSDSITSDVSTTATDNNDVNFWTTTSSIVDDSTVDDIEPTTESDSFTTEPFTTAESTEITSTSDTTEEIGTSTEDGLLSSTTDEEDASSTSAIPTPASTVETFDKSSYEDWEISSTSGSDYETSPLTTDDSEPTDVSTTEELTEAPPTTNPPPSRIISYDHAIISKGEDVLIKWFCPPRNISVSVYKNATYSWYKLNKFYDSKSYIKVSVSTNHSEPGSGFVFILRQPLSIDAGMYVCEERDFTIRFFFYRLDVLSNDSLSSNPQTSCSQSFYGCCPDGVNNRLSLSMDSCPRPNDCRHSLFGCCPDNVTAAWGPKHMACPNLFFQPQLCASSEEKVTSIGSAAGNDAATTSSIWFMYLARDNYCKPFLADAGKYYDGAFSLLEQCQTSCVHPVNTLRCESEPDFYYCEEFEPQWYFDNLDMMCKRTRCIKGGNVFVTRGACESVCLPLKGLSRCREPAKIRGFPCRAMIRSVFYNIAQGQCDWFEYDGCGGNMNRYSDIQQCHEECASKAQLLFEDSYWMCRQPIDFGSCSRQIHPQSAYRGHRNFPSESQSRRWYFDAESKFCKEMIFSDCSGGNTNNFLSLQDCQQFCNAKKFSPEEICSQPVSPGTCHMNATRWYFDKVTNACLKFQFSGCNGNANNFLTNADCEAECTSKFVTSTQSSSTVQSTITVHTVSTAEPTEPAMVKKFVPAPLKKDPCEAVHTTGACVSRNSNKTVSIVRFYYDSLRGRCRAFQFSGCGSGPNMYDTKGDCISNCEFRLMKKSNRGCNPNHMDIRYCSSALPSATGSSVYVYNPIMNDCQALNTEARTHSSCTNLNKYLFTSERRCRAKCRTAKATVQNLQSRCLAPHDSISCDNQKIRFGFQEEIKQCITYKACHTSYSASFDLLENCQKVCEAKTLTDICSLPKDRGPCTGIRIRFYYNVAMRKCIMFIYGGCLGNLNRFTSEQECLHVCHEEMTLAVAHKITTRAPYPTTQPTIPPREDENDFIVHNYQGTLNYDICYPAPYYGTTGCQADSSEAELTRYFYDKNMGKCIEFIFSGCQAMPNNFETFADCERICTNRINKARSNNDGCYSNFMKCRDQNIIRWRSRPLVGKCIRFSACNEKEGFPSESACMHKCEAFYPKVVDLQDVCHMPPRLSNTKFLCDKMRRPGWIFDLGSRHCRMVQDLCPGYGNSFQSEEECQSICQPKKLRDVCRQPLDYGPCRNFSLRWHYDWNERTCKQFYYGGCFGNRNRFMTFKECQKACHDSDYCRLPLVDGQSQCDSSKAPVERFFYNTTSKKCESFQYAGCLGNANNFQSLIKCQKFCLSADDFVSETSRKDNRCEQDTPQSFMTSSCQDPIFQTPMLFFFFNKSDKKCGTFFAHVCMNEDIKTKIEGMNLFQSMKDCESACITSLITDTNQDNNVKKDFSTSELLRCFDPLLHNSNSGICATITNRYFFNATTKRCEKFSYNGCDSSKDRGNRFTSEELCREMCVDALNSKKISPPENCPVCKNHCEYGRVRMNNGCWSCQCHNPCEDVRCPFGTRCQVDCRRHGFHKWGCEAICHLNKIKHPERCLRSPHLAGEIDVKCSNVPYRRYFYDWRIGRCSSEVYTGCNETEALLDSTQNWFLNEEQCYEQCSDIVRKEYEQCLGSNCPENTKCVAYCWADQGTPKCNTKCLQVEKPGQCPHVKSTTPSCSWQICSVDAHCPEKQKCCPCSGKKASFCEEPVNCSTALYGCCWDKKTISREFGHSNCPGKPPIIDMFRQQRILAVERSLLSLECKVSAAPKPAIFWKRPLRDGEYYSVEPMEIFLDKESSKWVGRINISSVDSDNEGEWLCEANNVFGAMNRSIYVVVRTRKSRSIPTRKHFVPSSRENSESSFSINQTIIRAPKHTEVYLYCDVKVVSDTKFKWLFKTSQTHHSSPQILDSTNRILRISHWSRESAGVYTCLSNRSTEKRIIRADYIDQSELSSGAVILSKPAGHIPIGYVIKLQCLPDSLSNEIYEIIWYKDNRLLNNDRVMNYDYDLTIIIKDAQLSDAGLYSCVLISNLGEKRISTELTIVP